MGLVSTGGVHSSMDHLLKLTEIAKEYGLENVFVHAFLDGRDTDPKSGKGFLEKLQDHLQKTTGKIATMVGRYYAMDRDKRWERVKEAYDLMVYGKGIETTDMISALQTSYDENITDEFVKPTVHVDENGQPIGKIEKETWLFSLIIVMTVLKN